MWQAAITANGCLAQRGSQLAERHSVLAMVEVEPHLWTGSDSHVLLMKTKMKSWGGGLRDSVSNTLRMTPDCIQLVA